MISITPEVSVRYEIRPGDLEAVLSENARRRPARLSMPLISLALTAGMLAFLCIYLIGGRTATAPAIFGGAFVVGAVTLWSPRRAREMAVKRVVELTL
jgi:hypothetical protein